MASGGVHSTATPPSTASEAVVVKGTMAPSAPVASAETEPGSVRVGAVVSCTSTVKRVLAELR